MFIHGDIIDREVEGNCYRITVSVGHVVFYDLLGGIADALEIELDQPVLVREELYSSVRLGSISLVNIPFDSLLSIECVSKEHRRSDALADATAVNE